MKIKPESHFDTLKAFISYIGPAVLQKTFYNQSFIAKQAVEAFTNMISNCIFSETLQVILSGYHSKIWNGKEKSFEYLLTFVK